MVRFPAYPRFIFAIFVHIHNFEVANPLDKEVNLDKNIVENDGCLFKVSETLCVSLERFEQFLYNRGRFIIIYDYYKLYLP